MLVFCENPPVCNVISHVSVQFSRSVMSDSLRPHAIDKTSTLKKKSFSTVRATQKGSQHYMEKRRGRRELEDEKEQGTVMVNILCQLD